MKTRAFAAALLAVAGAVAVNAAQAEGKIYVGGKLAIADPDFTGFDNAYTAGVYGGYNLFGRDAQFAADLGGGTMAVEGELMLTTAKGKAGLAGKWDLTSFGVYAAYRYPLGDLFYLKGRIGAVHYDVNTTYASIYSGNEFKLAAGVGGGVKVGPGRIEADITTYESDILTYGVGFHMTF